ncbi:hypothetical protein BH09MYX1_BH09MYX1_47040 [soil metagenome]
MARARALVVDDVRSFGAYLKCLLRVEDVDADVVTSIGAALRAMHENTYDLFLLDSVLADGESGYAILNCVRATAATAQAPVIMVTGEDGPALVRGLRAGADDYLTKPLDEEVLRARVRAALRASLLRRGGETVEERARAARLQRACLPAVPCTRGRMAVSGEVLACTDLSGDLFDVVEDESGRASAILVDASGHGTAAALVASAVRADLRSRLADGRPLFECIHAIARAMSAMANDVVPSAALGIVRSSQDGTMVEVVNAGLPPILIASGGRSRLIEAQLPPLGLTALTKAPVATIPILGETAFLLASDGLDPTAIGDEAFSRLRVLLERHGSRLARARIEELRQIIVETAELSNERVDDASLLIAEVSPGPRRPVASG